MILTAVTVVCPVLWRETEISVQICRKKARVNVWRFVASTYQVSLKGLSSNAQSLLILLVGEPGNSNGELLAA
jgi:hypothetical protein